MKIALKVLLAMALALVEHVAMATPARCTPGYQDSTCLTAIQHGSIPAPMCSTDPGWTTTGQAVWLGSYWGQPSCAYQAPPSCPAGYQQTSPPAWTGSSWTQPICTAIPQQPTPPAGHVLVATATTNSCGTLGTLNTYADGTYDASNPDWSQTFSGTWDQMYNNGTAYMNANYARYYQPMYITQPSDPNTATQYLSRVFLVYNPWACGGGVG